MKRMGYVLALTVGAGLGAGIGAAPAHAETATTAASGLQLSLSAAGATQTDTALSLVVRFDGGTLRLIELQVDGVTVKHKNIATRRDHGQIEFQMEAGLLSEGTHEIVVKALDAQGNSATTSTQIKVTPGASGLVKFQFPRNKAMVQGTVPIEIKLDASIRNPYVSFFIDDAFFSLSNYAPFTANWDSTRVPNGLHTVSVEVYDGDTLAKLKSTSLQLNVNNPGGLTTRQKDIADLSHAPTPNPARSVAATPQAAVEQSLQNAAPKTLRVKSLPPVEAMTSLPAAPGMNTPRSTSSRLGDSQSRTPAPGKFFAPLAPDTRITQLLPVPRANALPVVTLALANADRNGSPLQPHVSAVRPGLRGLFAAPRELSSLQSFSLLNNRPAHLPVMPRRAGNMAARPSLMMGMPDMQMSQNIAPALFAPAAPRAIVRSIKPTARPSALQIARIPQALRPMLGPGVVRGKAHSIQVAFDNTRIAFDVQPRVVRGLPVAPFRQIFEHTGGKITWFNQSKTLRAVNSEHEIELKVGADEATVNNHAVKMETKSFIEKGRTIVPLSFVRDALNVNVQYDAKTGHLRIESKK